MSALFITVLGDYRAFQAVGKIEQPPLHDFHMQVRRVALRHQRCRYFRIEKPYSGAWLYTTPRGKVATRPTIDPKQKTYFRFRSKKKTEKNDEGRTKIDVNSGSIYALVLFSYLCSWFAWPYQPGRMSGLHESKRAACAGRSRFHSSFSQIPQSWKRDNCRAFPSPLRRHFSPSWRKGS